ncbi:MAG TPA: glycosyltransferase 87 family protein [Chloroflexota bacterium]
MSCWRKLRNAAVEHREFCYLFAAAASLRVFAVLLLDVGRLIPHTNDYRYYRDFAELSLYGHYPFLHYWLEYPPVLAWFVVGVFRLSILLPPLHDESFWFFLLFGCSMAVLDVANVLLVYLIAVRLYDRALALRAATLYAATFAPLSILLAWSDPLPLTTLLLSLLLLLDQRPTLAGLVTGIGFTTKVFPVVVGYVGLVTLPRRVQRLRLALSALAAIAVVALPFALAAPQFLVAFLQNLMARGAWETVWALLDGYYSVGAVAPLADRFRPETASIRPYEPRVPWLAINAAFGVALLSLALLRRRWHGPPGIVSLASVTMLLTLFFSKGYSPQFLLYLYPFIALLLPNVRGLVYALVLTALNVLQYPVYHFLFPTAKALLVAVVVARTAVWSVLGIEFLAVALPALAASWRRVRRHALVLGAATGVLTVAVGVPALGRDLAMKTPYAEAARAIADDGRPATPVVYSDPKAFYFGNPWLPGRASFVVHEAWQEQVELERRRLIEFANQHEEVWVVLNYDESDFARIAFVETTLRAYGPIVFDRWFDTIRVARFASSQRLIAEESLQRTAVAFGDQLVLMGHSAIPPEVHPPAALRIVTRWRLDQPVDGQIKLFVHLADDDLRPVRQVDKLLLSPGSPAGVGGQPQALVDAAELALDESLAPGMYRLLLGLYHAPDGPRLRTHPDNRDFIELGHVIVGPPSSSSEARERCC